MIKKKLIPPPQSHLWQGPRAELTLSIRCRLHNELWYLVSLGLQFNIPLHAQNPVLYISPKCVAINQKMMLKFGAVHHVCSYTNSFYGEKRYSLETGQFLNFSATMKCSVWVWLQFTCLFLASVNTWECVRIHAVVPNSQSMKHSVFSPRGSSD